MRLFELSQPVEAYGYAYNNRDQRVMWRKNFASAEAAYAWAEKKNATVLGTRNLNESSEESCPACGSADVKTYSDGEKECNHCHHTWNVQGLNEFAPDGFSGGDDGEEFSPEMAKMAYDEGVVKGASLADGATTQRAMSINDWDKHDGGMYSQHFAKGFIAGRKDKIRHNNKQYDLNLQLMKDGSIRHGEQGVAEGWKDKVAGGALALGALGGIGAGIANSPMAYVKGQQIHMAMPGKIPNNAKLVTDDNGKKIYVWQPEELRSRGMKGQTQWVYRPADAQVKEQGVAESKSLSKRVRVVKGPDSGKTGWIREIKHGAFKGAPKTYYVDLDDGGQANNLPSTALRLVKEQSVSEMDKSQTPPGRDGGGQGGKEYTAKMTTTDKMMKHAHDTMMKAMSDADKVKNGWRNPNIRGNYDDEAKPIRDDGNEGRPGKQRYPGKK